MSVLENIRVVMVRTFHPGNIGSAARAMKTMGLTDLVLVQPVDFPSEAATQMAMSAEDVVTTARVVESLHEALADCSLVIASSARSREFDLPEKSPEASAEMLLDAAEAGGKVALVFGPERFGLSNDDLRLAHYRAQIPTHPQMKSLNIAAAVQTLSYEIYKQFLQREGKQEGGSKGCRVLPTVAEKEHFYAHLHSALVGTGFIVEQHPGKIMDKLRAVFDRAEMSKDEMAMLRGVLSSVDRCCAARDEGDS